MGEKYEAEVLVVGGKNKSDAAPPLNYKNKLEKFHSHLQTPFDIESESKIKNYLRDEYGRGYFRVYSPGFHQRMKTWFKGWVK